MFLCNGAKVPNTIMAASIKRKFLKALMEYINNPQMRGEISEAIKAESKRISEWKIYSKKLDKGDVK